MYIYIMEIYIMYIYIYIKCVIIYIEPFAADIPLLQEDEEDVSYEVESLFPNIPINETTDYILDHIYSKKILKTIYSSSNV